MLSPQRSTVVDAGNVIAPGPGRPAVWLIAVPVVAGMQNADARRSDVVPGAPTRTMGSRKQRRFFATHVPWPAVQLQSASVSHGCPSFAPPLQPFKHDDGCASPLHQPR